MKRINLTFIIGLATAMLFFSCAPVSDSSPFMSDSTEKGGIRIEVPLFAPWLADAFGTPGPDSELTRAFGLAENVEVLVVGSEEREERWTFSQDLTGNSFVRTIPLASGEEYRVTVNIYNNQVSETVPMVSGSLEDVSVSAGEMTPLTVTCLPVAPAVLEPDGPLDISLVPYVLNDDYSVETNGGELWFEAVGPPDGTLVLSPSLPEGIIFMAGVFDSAGIYLEDFTWYNQTPDKEPLVVSDLIPGETYYLVLMTLGDTQAPVEGTLTLSAPTSTALTDADVPDANLRAYLETATGKAFATAADPSPSDPIYNTDLAELGELDLSDMDITDFSGLEYCTGASDLTLDGTDLSILQSAQDEFIGPLTGMTSLNWLNMSRCGLSSLEFLTAVPGLVGLSLQSNPDLTAAAFDNLTPPNFPDLQYLYLSGWDVNEDGNWDGSDIFTGADWEDVMAILRPFTGMGSLELSDFHMNDADFAGLFEQGEVLDNNKDNLGSLFIRSGSLTDASLPLISQLSALEYLCLEGMGDITDLTAIQTMAGLEVLLLNGTGITDLTPLQVLYDNGAFQNHHSYRTLDIELKDCVDLPVTIASGNLAVIDNLEDHGVRIDYDEECALNGPWFFLASGGPDDEDFFLRMVISDSSYEQYLEDGSNFGSGLMSGWDNGIKSCVMIDHNGAYMKFTWEEVSGVPDKLELTVYNSEESYEDALASDSIMAVFLLYDDIGLIPPAIILEGDNPFYVLKDEPFTDPGAVGMDWGEDCAVSVSGTVDTGTVGTYILTYTATDADGNEAAPVTRDVMVHDGGVVDVTIY